MKRIIIVISMTIVFLSSLGYLINEVSKSRTFQFFGDFVTSVETNEKVVALTFDDGPGVNTDKILAILSDHDVKGTFYLTGHEIERFFDDGVNLVQAGHEIGNHTYSHKRMLLKSPSFIKKEIERTDELIRQIGYEGDITFRPPYGKRLLFLPYYLSKNARNTILWNIEPETYPEIASDSNNIINHVVDQIVPGSIILLHVMYESRIESLNALEGMVSSLKEQGYTFVTVSELLELESKER